MIQFVRHGESRFNIGINEKDPYLTEKGRLQASQICGNVSLVITSSMKRAQETLKYS